MVIDNINQGQYTWNVVAEYTQPGFGQPSVEEWIVRLYDAHIKGPSQALSRSGQTWYVDEYADWGPYSYEWNVWNSIGQKVVGPIYTSTLSVNQIPPVAYGNYVFDLEVTLDAGTKNRSRVILLDLD